ncbi:MAG: hypothetical protein U0Q21_03640 [Dermatophilaceae bacterium]
MTAKSFITDIRDRHAAATHRRDLERQLSVYAAPAEIEDLLATLDGEEGTDADIVRDILLDNLASHHRRGSIHNRAPLSA